VVVTKGRLAVCSALSKIFAPTFFAYGK